ncbi:hypothetical protein [Actinomadura atramentaria]|uniref:hypothetical protein n=1 Tax=Actinomadura atramentaria TaxID=1990 RepID=UPI0005277F00|nr:hypothetical protein [Actinomadura atramentaria]
MSTPPAPPPPGEDPGTLGPFRLTARLSESAAGTVFVGVDAEGRRAAVAVLNSGAAGDAAARDRFRSAILAALPGGPGSGGPDAAPVVAAQPEGPAPWVATEFDPERAGAERFLRPVLLDGVFEEGVRHGPRFRPHWEGSRPVLDRPAPPPVVSAPASGRPPERGLVAAVLTLVGILVVLGVLLVVLFACQPETSPPPRQPPEPTMTQPQPQQPSPSQTPMSPSPSPSTTGTVPPGDGGPL